MNVRLKARFGKDMTRLKSRLIPCYADHGINRRINHLVFTNAWLAIQTDPLLNKTKANFPGKPTVSATKSPLQCGNRFQPATEPPSLSSLGPEPVTLKK